MVDIVIGITGIIIGLGGAYISWLAYKEAGSAKVAANRAAQGVKRQTIALDVAEICQKCEIDLFIKYDGIVKKYHEVNDGVSRILGFYSKQEIEDSDCKKILDDDVANSLKAIKIQLDALNPGKQEAIEIPNQDVDKFYYYLFADLFNALSGNLNKFQGALENQLISHK